MRRALARGPRRALLPLPERLLLARSSNARAVVAHYPKLVVRHNAASQTEMFAARLISLRREYQFFVHVVALMYGAAQRLCTTPNILKMIAYTPRFG
jgi:hypothetical protein